MIKKAFILGAGLGTRLRPLTFIRPKPLVPVLGKPLIEYAIGHLKTVGIEHIIINTHHLPEEYSIRIGSGKKFGLNISYSYEPKLLDTGGGLKNIESFIGNETFIMYNGDIITDIDLGEMIRFHKEKGCIATLLVSKHDLPRHIRMDKDNKILELGSHLSSPSAGPLPTGERASEARVRGYAFCGIHILEPEIFQYIPPSKAISIITVYQELIKKGLPIMGYPLGDASWREIGDIHTYKKIHGKLLSPDGSTRKFFRIEIDEDSIIAMQYDPNKEENKFYADILTFLNNLGINVPRLIYNSQDSNTIFLEDLGDETLFSTCKNGIKIDLYKQVLDQIIKLHLQGKESYRKKPFPIPQPFSYKLYRWESSYFEENCLINYFKISLDKNTKTQLYKDFDFLAKRLSKEPQCPIHRDFQSKNIMVKNNNVYLIDFQGMRFGLPHYDLASLLYDPYVTMPSRTRKNLYGYYLENFPESDNFLEIYKYSAIQRLMQALGAYGYLGLKLGRKQFLSHIPQGLKNLALVLKEVDGLEGLKHIVPRISSGNFLE